MNKVVLLFKGSNCGPCKMFEPVFDKVMEDFEGLPAVKLTDELELARKLGVRGVPTVVLADQVDMSEFEVIATLTGRDLRGTTLRSAIEPFYNHRK